MPHRLLILVEYGRTFLAPIISYGSYTIFLQNIDLSNKPVWAIVGIAITALFTYLGIKATTRTKVEIKEIDVTSSADIQKTSLLLQIFDKAVADIDKARTHFTEELKEQRIDFFAKEKESRDHYENKEQELRDVYHTRQREAQNIIDKYSTRLTKIETQLKILGITISEECEIILPDSFERRKTER